MADGRIKELIDKFESLRLQKEEYESKAKAVKGEIKVVEEELALAINDAGMANVTDGGYTYTPGVKHKFYLRNRDEMEVEGIDVFEPFEADPDLSYLVHKDISWQAMQKPLQQIEESEEGLSDELKRVLTIADEFGVTRRKTNTETRDKVSAARAKAGK